MRTLLLSLGVVLVLSVTLPCRAEFDSGGIGPSKPQATQSATLFRSELASDSLVAVLVKTNDPAALLRLVKLRPKARVPVVLLDLSSLLPPPRTPCCFPRQSGATYPSNIPRPKHGGLTPLRVHGGIQ
jgi:hypothetical protein